MPEFADIWPHFFWRFLHTIFKPVIKHSRITVQKKAITIGNRITALKFVNWSQRGASKKKEPVYWTYCCSIYRLYLGFAIIQTRSRQKFSKQICLWNLVQGIGIIFIIQIVEAIWFFVAKTLPRLCLIVPSVEGVFAAAMSGDFSVFYQLLQGVLNRGLLDGGTQLHDFALGKLADLLLNSSTDKVHGG